MGEYACANLEVAIGARIAVGSGATGGAVKVGYLTEISCRKSSMSKGEALIGIAVGKMEKR